jgi:phosphoglycerate dehydrogenase-like enzyme
MLAARGHAVRFGSGGRDTEAVLTGGAPLTPELLQRAPELRIVVRFARGRYELAGERRLLAGNRIVYRHVSGGSAGSTAEHTVMLMLALLRRLPHAAMGRDQRALAELGLRDLSRSVVGLVGLGRVGRRVAELLRVFGSRVLYYKPHRLHSDEECVLGVEFAELEELLSRADVISLHARLGSEHDGLTPEQLHRIQPGGVLINTGDGRHLDLESLSKSAGERSLSLGLDVFPEEPRVLPEALRNSCDVLLTPHIAGRSQGAAAELFRLACEELHRSQEGTAPRLSVHVAELCGDGLGPVARSLCGALAREQPLRACRVGIPEARAADLPQLRRLAATLGAKVAQRTGPSDRIELETPSSRFAVQTELDPDRVVDGPGADVPIIAIRAVRDLVERWQMDYALWEHLLPRGGKGSLPGRLLHIVGYGPRGRLIAWRGRELGMRILVQDTSPRRRLDALGDGFSLAHGRAAGGSELMVRTGESGGDAASPLLRPPDSIPVGLSDELASAVAIVFAVLQTGATRQHPSAESRRSSLIEVCDTLLVDTLLTARDRNHVPSRVLWSADRW